MFSEHFVSDGRKAKRFNPSSNNAGRHYSLLRTSCLLAVLILYLSATPAFSQDRGTVTGIVTDETGGVLPGVTIELGVRPDIQITVTDSVGEFRFEEVPLGNTTLTFRLINFSVTRTDFEVTAGENTYNALLTLALTADLVVTGSRTFRNLTNLENPRENLVGIATSASVGAITSEQLATRPIMRPGEVLETVPGFITSQHSGEGKANQYYLRGFNLDHGSDFSTTLVGIPMNESSGAHAHGYSDVNLLIPELVSSVQYTKGPYFAEHGDFSAAGSAQINYMNRLERPFLDVSVGGQGWTRMLGAVSPQVGAGTVLAAVELGKNDGPWTTPDDMRKINGVLRYSSGDQRNGFSATAMGYSAKWHATDQIPLRAVESGLVSRFGNVDDSDAGRTFRYSGAFDWLSSSVNQTTRITAYGLRASLNLYQNFTYFLEHPIDGDQIEQEGHRVVSGGKIVHRRLADVFGRSIEIAVGSSLRHDQVGSVGLYNTVARRRVNTIRNDAVRQTTVGLFGQTEIEWNRFFRTTLGLRGDMYRFNVDAIRDENSGYGTSGLVSPKFTAVLGPWQLTELYLNFGTSFHSNDPRTATTHVDPITGEPVDAETPLVPARGAEIGVRSVAISSLQTTIALWFLEFDSELIFVGDAGIAEASRPSQRFGIEWTNYWTITDWLTGELNLSVSNARFSDYGPAGNLIPGSLDRVISGGLTFSPANRVFGSLRLRHFGPRPLIEDGSFMSNQTTIWNGEIGVNINDQVTVVAEGFNLLDSNVSDIDYYYTSRLPGEPTDGIDDIHFHPSLPRTARVALKLSF